MDQMLCRHREASVISICGQVDQPFDQLECDRKTRGIRQAIDVARVHNALTRIHDDSLLAIYVLFPHRYTMGDAHFRVDGVSHHHRTSCRGEREHSLSSGGRRLSRSAGAHTVVAAD